MNIAILIFLAVIMLALFNLIDRVARLDNGKKQEVVQPQSSQMMHFKNGGMHTWMMVNIALYKMYSELEILDYDSLQDKLTKTLEELSANENILAEWSQKFHAYVHTKDGGPDVP